MATLLCPSKKNCTARELPKDRKAKMYIFLPSFVYFRLKAYLRILEFGLKYQQMHFLQSSFILLSLNMKNKRFIRYMIGLKLLKYAIIALAIPMLSGCSGNGKDNNNTTTGNDTAQTKVDTNKRNDNQNSNESKNLLNTIETREDRQYNDLARLLAGLPAEEGSKFAKYHQTKAWQQYANTANNTWSGILTQKVPTMSKWSNDALKTQNDAKGTLFYPFSGPDFLHANTLFPGAEKIVMIGLEPIGNYPNLDKVANKSLNGYFNGLQRSLYTILKLSFFRTIAMAKDFTGKVTADIDGTLPVLMLFMARTKHRVLYYEKVAVNEEGELIAADDAIGRKVYYGTKLTYRHEDKPNEKKTLFYFAANLQNSPYSSRSGLVRKGLEDRSDFRKFLKSLDITTTYIKSASYLMHRETFSIIRNIILNQSKYFLQDDSGMALRYVDRSKWNLTFFGAYAGPIPLFRNRYQAGLRKAYSSGNNVKPLPFGIGYQYRKGTSNLMLAEKK
ncbi:conserved hypothetical protein [Microscilla marina ATCC 23134]|uniref:Uncharacterized protein n=2 Tax=Microscilla marina TaxID=1027 RepID=A1ZSB1_MICM2|nr:conserved hypothetical protein [Microscilla marina ATCC 23134]